MRYLERKSIFASGGITLSHRNTLASKHTRIETRAGLSRDTRRAPKTTPTTMSSGKRVCVIGGGTSGLAGMVQLINEGIEVRFFAGFRRISPHP